MRLIPAYRAYQLCQRLRISYEEYLAMPEDVVDMWLAFQDGEARAMSERRQPATG